MTEPVESSREVGGYRLLRRLGSGGMGTVHEAVDADGHRVALKLLHPHIATDPQARQRLAREVALLHRVKGAGVARVLDAEVEDAEAFVVTELVEGPTLEDDVNDGGAFSLDELAGLGHGLAASLRAIHAEGIVHRDLKPGNVMLADDGPVLIDFGIAQVADDVRLTQTGLVTGTPGYLDPGVIAGGDPGPAGDWWAWAAVLLFAATGRPPFGRGAMEAVLARVATGRADTTGLPGSVARTFQDALAPDPERRLPPEEVLAALDAAADDPAAAGSPQSADDAVAGAAAAGAAAVAAGDDAPPTAAWGTGAPATAPVIPPTMPVARDRGPGAPAEGATSPLPTSGYGAPGGGSATRVMPAVPPAGDGQAPGAPAPVDQPRPQGLALPGEEYPGAMPPGYAAGGSGTSTEGWSGQPGAPAPRWARPPRRRTGIVLAVGVGVSAAAASFPGIFAVVAGLLVVLTATTGWAGRSRRNSRLRRGVRSGDDARMVAGLPWHLLRGVLAVLPGVLIGAVMGGALWWFAPDLMPAAVPTELHEPLTFWVAGLLALFVAWLTPTSASARDGARAWLDVLTPGPGYRALLVTVFLGYAAVVGVQVALDQTPDVTWTPLPITLER